MDKNMSGLSNGGGCGRDGIQEAAETMFTETLR